MTLTAELMLVMAAAGAACALPGVFLLLRRLALVADAISHTLLFGIVLAYLAVKDLSSVWLYVGAAFSGVITVAVVETLRRTGRVKEDAAIGLVFPAMFAIGTILASLYTRDTHLDVDAVLLGQAELAPLDAIKVSGRLYIPRAALVLSAIFVCCTLLCLTFHKVLVITTFDAALAATLGFLPGVVHYSLMTVTSLTIVAAFDAVGPVLVVALLVVPATISYLLFKRLKWVLFGSVFIGTVTAALGAWLALRINSNVAGTVATLLGIAFAITVIFAPRTGLVHDWLRRRRLRDEFLQLMLVVHLKTHEGTPEEADESRISTLFTHLKRLEADVVKIVAQSERSGWVVKQGDYLKLTAKGRDFTF